MDALIDKTLSNLSSSNLRVADLKVSFQIFLEGLKSLSLNNACLKMEAKENSQTIKALEAKVKELMDEKVDMIASIESSQAAIESLESSLANVASLEPV